jgi:hypothetical protein
MPTYLFVWNPEIEPWKKLVAAHGIGKKSKANEWSTRNRRIRDGDRVFIVKVGQPPRGVIATGYAESPAFEKSRHNWYVRIRLSKVTDDPLYGFDSSGN